MDIREAMEKAEASLTAEATPEPASTPAPVVEAKAEPIKVEAPKASKPRDEGGKFVRTESVKAEDPAGTAPTVNGAAGAPTPEGQGGEAGPETPTAPASPSVRYPQSWSSADREAWAKMPPEAQRVVERREREMTRAMSELGQARQTVARVQQSLAPYEALARANGADPISYAGQVMQTAAALQMGSPTQKAAAVAQILSAYSVDVDIVNAHLQGQAPAQQRQAPAVDYRAEVERAIEDRVRQASDQRANQALEAFVATQPEFFDEVRETMAQVLAVAARSPDQRLRNMTFQQAYDRACELTPEVAQEMARRKTASAAAEAVRTPQGITDRTRAAASSVRTQPASAPRGKSTGIRAAMEAAAEKLGY